MLVSPHGGCHSVQALSVQTLRPVPTERGASYEEHDSDRCCDPGNVDCGNRFSCEYECAMRSVGWTDDIQYCNRASAACGAVEGSDGDCERTKQPEPARGTGGCCDCWLLACEVYFQGHDLHPGRYRRRYGLFAMALGRNGDSELFTASCHQQFLH